MQYVKKLTFLALGITITSCSIAGTLTGKTVTNKQSASDIVQNAKASKMTWYDGKQAREIWVAPDLVAEFSVGGALQSRSLLNINNNTLIKNSAAVRVWRVSEDASTLARRISQRSTSEKFTPVFRDAPGAGEMKALPGGVILILDSNLTQDQVDRWFEDNTITIDKRLNLSQYAYFIATAPGLDSLELANRIIEEDNGERSYVKSATPNWWSERTTK